MYTIAVANEKGGVAKTTTVISIGAAFAEMGLRVLMIDLDPQSTLYLAFGLDPAKTRRTIGEALMRPPHILPIERDTSVEGLHLVPASSSLSVLERFLPTQKDYEIILREALKSSTLDYDFILLDCPSFLGSLTLNALTAADLLLVPTQAEYFSILGLRNLMSVVRQVRAHNNPRLTYRLVLTMFDQRTRMHRMLRERLQTAFHGGMFETSIEIDTKIRESAYSGKPVLFYATTSRAAREYRSLAQEIYQYARQVES